MPDDLSQLDLDAIADPALRALIARLLNLLAEALAANEALRAENQRLSDEILRLKGEHPSRPKRPKDGSGDGSSGGAAPPANHSSEANRAAARGSLRGKRKRGLRRTLPVDRDEPCNEPPSGLPPDAVDKGIAPLVIQRLVCRRETVRYLRRKWYSPSTGKTYLAPLPAGCRSGYDAGLQALLLELNYGANVTMPQLLAWVNRRGFALAKGTLVGLLTRGLGRFETEVAAILAAGLKSSPWQQLDVTATPVGKEWHACHVLGNPFYRYFRTAPSQSRLAILETLRGGRPARYRLDEPAFARLTAAGVGARAQAWLRRLPGGPEWDAAAFAAHLDARPRLGQDTRAAILEAAALSAYQADPDWPVIACLLGDDAVQFRELTDALALCWVHDARHYQKLAPPFASFRAELEAFQAEYWAFYRQLQAYRTAPTEAQATLLRTEFDTLFQGGKTYAALERCIARTRENKAKLLLVLTHPELPLHNNDSELAARKRVIKRRVSHGPQSAAGAKAWDTFHTLAATTAKLGISLADYLEDRLTGAGNIPWLPDVITQRAKEHSLGWSWQRI